jgi:GT2 family glycosyltransferase/glycosyltransferase involved in cell wall biosynthesis
MENILIWSPASGVLAETQRLPPAALLGNLDGVHGRCVEGWVFDPAAPLREITVEIFEGERLLGTAPARLFRGDLASAGVGDGSHAFRFLIPLELFDGQDHDISVRIRDEHYTVPGSPFRLKTALLPTDVIFTGTSEAVAATPPLSDLQFGMLRSLNAMTEALLIQNRTLGALLERLTPEAALSPRGGMPTPTPEPPSPLHFAARAHSAGSHDYIFFSIIDWSFRIQRPQHLATRLAAMGNRVFYLSITFEPMQAGARRFAIRSNPAPGVFEVTLRCQPPAPLIYGGFDDPQQVAQLTAALADLATDLKLKSPVGVMQFPSWLPIAASVPGLTLVFDCLDHLAGFNGVAPRVVELEKVLIQQADCVTVTSEYLNRLVRRVRPCEIVRNGVEAAYFSRPPATLYEPASRPVIGYYGAIADWFDIDLVATCARRNPEWRFVLIGEVNGCDISAAQELPNIELLGEQPYDKLTFYLYAFDVCIIPFKLVDLIKATNPVKAYEYLCAGKPVVATDIPELRLLPPRMIEIARSAEEFEARITAHLEGPDAAQAGRRQAWAARHSWDARARKLANLVTRQFPRVSVVVLCHNSLQFTKACLASLIEHSDYPNLELVCVDNASTDDTPVYLADLGARHAFVKHVDSGTNLGFAGGNNLGIRAASGEIVVLLNNDTYVTRGWVRDLIRPLLRDETIGMTGPLSNNIGNEQKIAIAYSNMEEMAATSAVFTAQHRRRTYEVKALAFFCVAIRRDVIAKVGLLDEEYQLGFFEDDDYCARARKAGYRLAVCDDVFVHHHLSASFGQLGTPERAALMKRNRKLFESKWGQWEPHRYRDAEGFGDK